MMMTPLGFAPTWHSFGLISEIAGEDACGMRGVVQ